MKQWLYILALCFVAVSAITSNLIFDIPVKTLIFLLMMISALKLIADKTIRIQLYELKLIFLLAFFLIWWGG